MNTLDYIEPGGKKQGKPRENYRKIHELFRKPGPELHKAPEAGGQLPPVY